MTTRTPTPNIDPDMRPFWDALRERRFKLLRCTACGTWYWPVADCRRCGLSRPFLGHMHWEEASGRGTVFAFNIHHIAFLPGFAELVPYVYALIALDEGPTFGTRISGCNPESVYIGMPVQVDFEDDEAGYVLPVARPTQLDK